MQFVWWRNPRRQLAQAYNKQVANDIKSGVRGRVAESGASGQLPFV